jgi:hypothetical protein
MARPPKPIDGAISDVGAIEPHPSGYRIRFRLNGTNTERYRKTKKQAQELRAVLIQKADGTKAGLEVASTNLPAFRLRAAETAFHLLDSAKLTSPNNEASAKHLIDAVQRFIEDDAKAGMEITVADAYDLFLAKQATRDLSPKTMKDYKRFVGAFVEAQNGTPLSLVSPAECQRFIFEQPSDVAKFKAYGYLYAFLNFCKGDNNPNIDPNKDKPWIQANPINFEKPGYTPKDVHSYTLAEIRTILKKGKDRGSLGYLLFRLHTMARFDETERFIALGGADWKANPYIDLTHNRIHFNPTVYLKRNGNEDRGRYIPITPIFRKWIDYLSEHGLGFGYVRQDDEVARKEAGKFGRNTGYTNMLRHTGITMHIRAFKDPMTTAKIAGTSVSVIEKNYMNINISEADAVGFYALTPNKLGFR